MKYDHIEDTFFGDIAVRSNQKQPIQLNRTPILDLIDVIISKLIIRIII